MFCVDHKNYPRKVSIMDNVSRPNSPFLEQSPAFLIFSAPQKTAYRQDKPLSTYGTQQVVMPDPGDIATLAAVNLFRP
jgi:hypothetical protein